MLRGLQSFGKQKGFSTPQRLPDASSTADNEPKSAPAPFEENSIAGTLSEIQSTSDASPHPCPDVDLARVPSNSTHKPRPGAGKIADRIRSINDLQRLSQSPVQVTTSKSSSNLRRKVSTATASRAMPFIRRYSAATPLNAQDLYLSTLQQHIHSPKPERFQPELSRTIEKGAHVSSSQANTAAHNSDYRGKDEFTVKNGAFNSTSGQSSNNFKPVPEPDQARNHVICPRHGRNLARRKNIVTSSSGLERSVSGAYIPTGHKLRHQVDALSPWVRSRECLAKKKGTTVSPGVCPDCIAEQDILTRELFGSAQVEAERIKRPGSAHTSLGPSSIITEPGTPVSEGLVNVLVGSAHDHQSISLPGAAISRTSLDDVGSIIAADLGDMIDAIVIEHSGTLDKVITNLRDRIAGPDRMQKLSQDLVKVSEAVAAVPENKQKSHATFIRDAQGKHSMVLDVDSGLLRQRTRSIPQLLELIDNTAGDLGLNLSKAHDVDNGGHGSASTAEAPASGMKAMQGPVRGSLQIPGCITPYTMTPNASAFNTPLPTPTTTSSTPPYLPLHRPSQASFDTPSGPTLLPSEVFRGQDLTPLPSLDDNTNTILYSSIINARSPVAVEGLSRKPSWKRTSNIFHAAGVVPRLYEQSCSVGLAPYQRSSGARAGARAAPLVKPSEVVGRQKQQRTFEQEWLRDPSRAKSSAERVGRREKVAGLGGIETRDGGGHDTHGAVSGKGGDQGKTAGPVRSGDGALSE